MSVVSGQPCPTALQTLCWAFHVGAAQPYGPVSLVSGQPCLSCSPQPSVALGRAGADGDDDDGGSAALQGSLLPPAAEARLWEGGQMPPGTLEQ